MPPWTWAFIVVGLLGVIIAQLATQKVAAGRLPMLTSRRRLISSLRWGGLVAAGLGLVLLIVAAANDSGGVLWLGMLAFFGGLVAASVVYAIVRVRGRVYSDSRMPDTWVLIRNAHPNFVAAVDSWRATLTQAQTGS